MSPTSSPGGSGSPRSVRTWRPRGPMKSPQALSLGNCALSSSATLAPARASTREATLPAGPAPTTSTSKRLGLTRLLSAPTAYSEIFTPKEAQWAFLVPDPGSEHQVHDQLRRGDSLRGHPGDQDASPIAPGQCLRRALGEDRAHRMPRLAAHSGPRSPRTGTSPVRLPLQPTAPAPWNRS